VNLLFPSLIYVNNILSSSSKPETNLIKINRFQFPETAIKSTTRLYNGDVTSFRPLICFSLDSISPVCTLNNDEYHFCPAAQTLPMQSSSLKVGVLLLSFVTHTELQMLCSTSQVPLLLLSMDPGERQHFVHDEKSIFIVGIYRHYDGSSTNTCFFWRP
jgi:hypothetical protein